MIVWEDVITNRAVLLEKLNERYLTFFSQNVPEAMEEDDKSQVNLSLLKTTLIQERADMYREMATSARKQSNFYVADLYLKLCLKAKARRKEFVFPFFHSLVKLHCLKANATSSVDDSIDKFLKALKFVDGKKNESSILENPNYQRKYFLLRV